ncbi:MAG: aldo/keto reductase [Candidatus Riflebacteria bacterium]|nr:aldo/keto reductase [Candidatus Riflebacteria bacterium]
MEIKKLGNTGISVSRLAIGTLTMSPFQRGLSTEAGAEVILAALDKNVNFIDTAQMYGSYNQVSMALSQWKGEKPVVSTKSIAGTAQLMESAIEEFRKVMNIDIIDIFLMHAVKDENAFIQRKPAFDVLLAAKAKGVIRAVGASTHSVKTTAYLSSISELDIIHPIINMAGIGNIDGTRDEMLSNIARAVKSGKGIYAMKPMGGGHLRHEASEALKWISSISNIHSVCVGMTSKSEVEMNCSIFNGLDVTVEFEKKIAAQERKLFVNEALCVACGKCVELCQQNALKIIDKKLQINESNCILCGYCAKDCPTFAIRVI